MRLITVLLFTMLLISGRALADMSDDEYVTKYFGTQLLMHTSTQLVDPNVDYWTNRLPSQLNYDSAYVAGVVNAARLSRGESVLLDPMQSIVIPGMENYDDSGYVYDISFVDIRPSEVELLLATLGGASKILPGMELEYAPLMMKSFWVSSQDLNSTLTVNVGKSTLDITSDMSVSDIHAKLVKLFNDEYGTNINIDLYFSQSIASYGNSIDFSFTATMEGAPNYYGGEDYEGAI